MFFNAFTIEGGTFCLCMLNRISGELTIYDEAKTFTGSIYHNGYLWFINNEHTTCYVSRLDPNTGEVSVLTDEVYANQSNRIFIAGDRLYFCGLDKNESGSGNTIPHLFSINLDGSGLRSEDEFNVYSYIFNDGWIYYFNPAECSHTENGAVDRMLCRTNIFTGETQELMGMYYCSNFFPAMYFGYKGVVVREDLTGTAEGTLNYWYIPYNNGVPVLIMTE